MIVTDNFVYIHAPKTGGTFVTAMIEAAAQATPDFHATDLAGLKHAGVRRIPEQFRQLPVVTNRRNVFSQYVSRYYYRWWAVDIHVKQKYDLARVKNDYPSFPDLAFSEYLRFVNHWPYLTQIRPGVRQLLEQRKLGFNTWSFARLTQQKPVEFLRDFDAWTDEQLREHFSTTRFLKTESLNNDLVSLLIDSGVSSRNIDFILKNKPVLPNPAERNGKRSWLAQITSRLAAFSGKSREPVQKKRWQELFTQDDIDFVLHRDRLYFRLFPEMIPGGISAQDK